MTNVYFVSVNDIKENTTINYSVEDKLIENSILDSQHIDIESLLGTRLYKKIDDLIVTDGITGETNAIYKELLDDYIFDTLIKSVQKRVLLYIYTKIRNTGVVNQDSDNSSTVDITILNKMRGEIGDDFEYYSNKLKQFLCDSDIEEYVDYNPNTLSYYKKPTTGNSYFSGLVL